MPGAHASTSLNNRESARFGSTPLTDRSNKFWCLSGVEGNANFTDSKG